MKLIYFIAISIVLFLSCKGGDPIQEEIKFTNLFNTVDTTSSMCYRIPSLLKAHNGTLIATIDERIESCNDLRSNNDINIVIRRSSDHGDTWSDIESIVDFPYGESASDPSMILDEATGEIFLFYNYMNLKKSNKQYFLHVISSIDNGVTWSAFQDITNQISKEGWGSDFKFITSGKGTQLQSGTLLHTLVNLEHGLHIFGSDDHGNTWYLIDTPIQPGDESKIVELSNGTWMINSRVNKSGLRYTHVSEDQGKSWISRSDSTLIDPSCNASLIRYTRKGNEHAKDRLLFSNLQSTDKRENLTIYISYDEGKSWKYSKTVYRGSSAYSSLSILDNGDIGVFFEKDDYRQNVFARVTLTWLTDGNDVIDAD